MRRTRGLVVLFAAAGLAAASLASGASAAPAQVSGYIVVLEDGAGAPAAVAERLADRYGGEVGYIYRYALRGFYIRTTVRAAAAMASNPKVDYVEAESPVTIDVQTTPTGIARTFATSNSSIGIDGSDKRVDVDVAVLDTGIDLDHPDLLVAGSISCVNVASASSCKGAGQDGHGHGTHVAGTIAALDNAVGVVGMAPGARLWSVKVLDDSGSGSNAGVAAGLDWVIQHNKDTTDDIEVANLSLGGGRSTTMDSAVARAVGAGVTVVVAAGNDGKDAANYSPAAEPSAITVSALADFNGQPGGGAGWTCYPDVDDTFANFSNYGSVVDIIAPGMCITSTIPDGYGSKSGTSMAAPHVAGAAALLRSAGVDHQNTESLLKSTGNFAWSGDKDKILEPLLDVSDSTVFDPKYVGETGTEPPNAAPMANFTYACSGLTCDFTDTSSDSDVGDTLSWSWSFGDGGTDTAQHPTHSYPAGGPYPVTLTVSDGEKTDSFTDSVTVTAPDAGGGTTTLSLVAAEEQPTKGGWLATVLVSGAPPGSVTGTWSDGGTPSSCSVGANGTCDITRKLNKRSKVVTWTYSGSPSVSLEFTSPL